MRQQDGRRSTAFRQSVHLPVARRGRQQPVLATGWAPVTGIRSHRVVPVTDHLCRNASARIDLATFEAASAKPRLPRAAVSSSSPVTLPTCGDIGYVRASERFAIIAARRSVPGNHDVGSCMSGRVPGVADAELGRWRRGIDTPWMDASRTSATSSTHRETARRVPAAHVWCSDTIVP
jgi:hypothetical protein